MGLRVGAGAGSLSQPGAPSMTMAGMQQAASEPVTNKAPAIADPAPARAPASAPPAGGGDEASNLLSQLQSMAKPPQSAAGQQAMQYRPLLEMAGTKEGLMDSVANHPFEMAGQVLGGVGGTMLGGPGGGIAGVGIGTIVGAKLDALRAGKPLDSVATGMDAAIGMATHGAMARMTGGSAPAAAATESGAATSPEVQQSTAGVREKAANVQSLAKDIGVNVLKQQLDPTGPYGAQQAQITQQVAQGQHGPVAQQALYSTLLTQANALENHIGSLDNIVPKLGGKDVDIGNALQTMHETHGKLISNYRSGAGNDGLYDVNSMKDALTSVFKETGAIDSENNVREFPLDGGRGTAVKNFVQSMQKLEYGSSQNDLISGSWSQWFKGQKSGTPTPSPAELNNFFQKGSQPSGGMYLDLDSFQALLKGVRDHVYAPGGGEMESARPMFRALDAKLTDHYYDFLSKSFEQKGDTFTAGRIQELGAQYKILSDVGRDVDTVMDKAPHTAVDLIVKPNDPARTAQLLRLMNPGQQDALQRTMFANAVENSTRSNGYMSADNIKSELQGYGKENLKTVFGDNHDAVMKTLDAASQLQNSKISFEAAKPMADGFLKNLAQLPGKMGAGAYDILKRLVDPQQRSDVSNLIASPDAAEKLYRYQQANSTKAKMSAPARGAVNSIPGAAIVPFMRQQTDREDQ